MAEMLRRRVEAVLRGEPEAVRLERPLLDPSDWVTLARWFIDLAKRPVALPPPVHLARRHRVEVLDRGLPGGAGECSDGRRIYARWDASPRVFGGRVFHGLGHVVLVKAEVDHEESDAIGVACELALPTEIARRVHRVTAAMELQAHAPEWLLRAQILAVMGRELAA